MSRVNDGSLVVKLEEVNGKQKKCCCVSQKVLCNNQSVNALVIRYRIKRCFNDVICNSCPRTCSEFVQRFVGIKCQTENYCLSTAATTMSRRKQSNPKPLLKSMLIF